MGKSLDEVRRDWEQLGAEDPLWAVLMKPGTRHGGWEVDAFLRTGQQEVDDALEHLRSLVTLPELTRVLDFGAGAGRISQALARHSPSVVGLDISGPMLETARRLDRTAGRCEFVLNEHDDLSMFADASFDLVYSSLVLQHIPPAAAAIFLAEMGRVVRPGGAIVTQVASEPIRSAKGLLFRYAPHWLLRWGQQRVLGYPAPMRMHGISSDELTSAFRPHSVEVLDRVEDTTYGGHWTYHRYFAVKRA